MANRSASKHLACRFARPILDESHTLVLTEFRHRDLEIGFCTIDRDGGAALFDWTDKVDVARAAIVRRQLLQWKMHAEALEAEFLGMLDPMLAGGVKRRRERPRLAREPRERASAPIPPAPIGERIS